MENPHYYAVIPSEVRYCDQITDFEKILYGEISALANEKGFCNASNEYFAKLYKCHKKTVSLHISNLKKHGFVDVKLVYQGKEVKERNIYLSTISWRGIHENAEENKEEEEINIEKILNVYENNIGLMPTFVPEILQDFLREGMQEELIVTAIEESASRGARNWKYINTILANCSNQHIYTKIQYLENQRQYKNKSDQKKEIKAKEAPKNYNNDFSEYDNFARRKEEDE